MQDFSVFQCNDAVCLEGGLFVMGDQQDGLSVLPVGKLQQVDGFF